MDILISLAKALWEYLLGEAAKPAGADISSASVVVPLGSGYNREAEESSKRQQIVEHARAQIGKAYLLGTEVQPGHEADSESWDCSELVEAAYRQSGLTIPDGSNYQYDHCRPVKFPKAGDLGFLWSDKWGRIGHVMIATGTGSIIQAVGGRGVVMDSQSWADSHPRFRGWRRHPEFSWPPEERA